MYIIDSKELYKRLQSNFNNSVLVDVRTLNEWNNGVIYDIDNIFFITVLHMTILNKDFIKILKNKVSKDKELYFICSSGKRSQISSLLALQNGYTKVYNISDGMQGWLVNNLPIIDYKK